MESEPIVSVVDDDPAARRSLAAMLTAKGLNVETYASAEEFLEESDPSQHGCLVVDVRMGGISGLELQAKLREEKVSLPVIVITGYGNVPTAVSAMKAGAVTFLEKPCIDYELCNSVQAALKQHRQQRESEARHAELQMRLERLSPQERLVMEKLVDGTPNKVIAAELEIGLRTVELRRANVMKKMKADNLAELVQIHMELNESVKDAV